MYKYVYIYDQVNGYFESDFELDLKNTCNYTIYHKMRIVASRTPELLARVYALPFDESGYTMSDLLSKVEIHAVSRRAPFKVGEDIPWKLHKNI